MAQVRAQVLDTIVTLLSGEVKKLRFCLGRELAELGAAFSRIAEKVPAGVMVGEVLCESEMQKLFGDA